MYRKIRLLTKRKQQSSFNHLVISRGDHEEVITSPTDMIHRLIQRNLTHFSQAQGTPFSIPPLSETHNILTASPLPAISQSSAVQAILQYLKDSPNLPHISTEINVEDIKSLYQAWKESTTTSPSGLHLGHNKGLLQYENSDDLHDIPNRLFKIKTQFINLAIKHGVVYDRWKKINTVMIEKQPNVYHIDKLRALHLFESDINGVLGIIWGRRLMANAE